MSGSDSISKDFFRLPPEFYDLMKPGESFREFYQIAFAENLFEHVYTIMPRALYYNSARDILNDRNSYPQHLCKLIYMVIVGVDSDEEVQSFLEYVYSHLKDDHHLYGSSVLTKNEEGEFEVTLYMSVLSHLEPLLVKLDGIWRRTKKRKTKMKNLLKVWMLLPRRKYLFKTLVVDHIFRSLYWTENKVTYDHFFYPLAANATTLIIDLPASVLRMPKKPSCPFWHYSVRPSMQDYLNIIVYTLGELALEAGLNMSCVFLNWDLDDIELGGVMVNNLCFNPFHDTDKLSFFSEDLIWNSTPYHTYHGKDYKLLLDLYFINQRTQDIADKHLIFTKPGDTIDIGTGQYVELTVHRD